MLVDGTGFMMRIGRSPDLTIKVCLLTLCALVFSACGPEQSVSISAEEDSAIIDQIDAVASNDEVEGTQAEIPAIEAPSQEFSLSSPSFKQGEPIPARYSCDGEDISPALIWSDAPSEAVSFTLIMDDPDAPGGTWTHWVLFNIPADRTNLDEAVSAEPILPDNSMHGENSWNRSDYGGPCPPGGTHRYFFKIYALDGSLELTAGSTVGDVLRGMQDHILDEASLMGTYTR